MIGADSNAFTYLVKAMSGLYDPAVDTSSLAEERVAMLRIFLYGQDTLCLTPTVRQEYSRMGKVTWRRFHEDVNKFLLVDGPWDFDQRLLAERVSELTGLHEDRDDCQIAAEAEQAGLMPLLSFDSHFATRLNPVLQGVRIVEPSAHWRSLGILPGARPRVLPTAENPLSKVDWWRW